MNHAQGLIRNLGQGISFQFEEFRIMTKTTFKGVFRGRIPSDEEIEASGILGHDSVEDLVAEMDALGYDRIVACATKMWSPHYHHQLIMDCPTKDLAAVVDASGGRLIGAASYNPFRIDQSLREIEQAVRDFGFRYVWFHPLSYGLAPDDARFYPLYAKCSELGIPWGSKSGTRRRCCRAMGAAP